MNEPKEKTAASHLPRLRTGIDGFDAITDGGLPLNRISIVAGDTGTGKTVFSLQVLANNVRYWNVSGIFVAFEENSRDILINAASFGWDLATLESENKLYFFDAYLPPDIGQSGEFDLIGILAGITAKAQEMGAQLIVFDSIDSLLMLLSDPLSERRECYRLRDWLRQSGLTAIITVRNRSSNEMAITLAYDRFNDVMRFMADCVILLRQQVIERVSLRDLRVVKYRGVLFHENAFPMVIASDGIDVSSYGQESPVISMPLERLSSGIESLDALLGGGYVRGASVLITGTPGTGKSSFAGAFAAAACRRGEHTLYVSFDQNPAAQVRDLSSVGIQLSPHIESGVLVMYGASSTLRRAEEHMVRLKTLIRQHQARCLIIDPLSAPLRAVGRAAGLSVAEQLLHHAWLLGITVVFTSVSRGGNPLEEELVEQISPIADTWINLSYLVKNGEYKRALLIIKSRGTKHAHKMHEIVFTDSGVIVKELDIAPAEGLRQEQGRTGEQSSDTASDAGKNHAATDGQVAGLKRELKELRNELALLFARQNTLEGQWKTVQSGSIHNPSANKNH